MAAPVTMDMIRMILDVGCHMPDCDRAHQATDRLYMHGRCHPEAPVNVAVQATGEAVVTCYVCDALIVTLLIAESQPTEPMWYGAT